MTRINLLTIAVVGLLALNLGLLAFLLFQKPPSNLPNRRFGEQEGPRQIIIEKLQFDSSQVSQYDALIKEHRNSIQVLDKEIMDSKRSLYLTLANDSNNNKDSLINKINEFQKQVEETHYNHFSSIKKICKPSQANNFNDLTEELARLFSPRRNLPPPPKD